MPVPSRQKIFNQFHFILAIALLLFFLQACNGGNEENKNQKVIADSLKSSQLYKDDSLLQALVIRYPDSLLLKENLIQLYRDRSDYPKAIESINRFISQDSTNPRFWEIKGTLHFEAADSLEAAVAFEKKMQLQPEATIFYKLGMIYAYLSNPKATAIAIRLQADPNPELQSNGYLIQGVFETRMGDFSKALAQFDESLLLNHSFMQTYMEKAYCQDLNHQTDDAIKTLKKAVALNNQFVDGYFQLGIYYEKMNDTKSALQAYSKAALYDPEFGEANEAVSRLSQ